MAVTLLEKPKNKQTDKTTLTNSRGGRKKVVLCASGQGLVVIKVCKHTCIVRMKETILRETVSRCSIKLLSIMARGCMNHIGEIC